MQNYLERLTESSRQTGNLLCMGLDPIYEYLPGNTGAVREDLNRFYSTIFRRMNLEGVYPAAFKPNIGYFSALDRPREESFEGSLALSDLLDMLESFFPGIPVILDSKRGDIARSSENYSIEAFDLWDCDAVTVSPYMGSDSVSPFFREARGLYVLNRTSNPGSKDLQSLACEDATLYEKTADAIIRWASIHPGTGAVVGATHPEELSRLARRYAAASVPVPLLIPGVGSQGGSAPEVMRLLSEASYDLSIVRINCSSALTHPWKSTEIPEGWEDIILKAIETYTGEMAL